MIRLITGFESTILNADPAVYETAGRRQRSHESIDQATLASDAGRVFVSTDSAVHDTGIRRRLVHELSELDRVIKRLNFTDEKTGQIKNWHSSFSNALRSYRNENEVLAEYIRLLQEILIDPMTQAPLDKRSVLGNTANDKNTYSWLTLTVYWEATSEVYRRRSPLDPENPTPFSFTPHLVVHAFLEWLESHDALLVSRELEEAAQRIILESSPQERVTEETLNARVIEARARSAENRRAGEVGRLAQQQEIMRIEGDFFAELAALAAELDEREPGLRVVERAIAQTDERNRVELTGMAADLAALEARTQEGIRAAHERIDEMGHRLDDAIQAQQAAEIRDQIALADLQMRIRGGVQLALQPAVDHIEGHREAGAERIVSMVERHAVAVNRLNAAAHQMGVEIEQLRSSYAQMQVSNAERDASISEAKKETQALKEDIAKAFIEVKELNKNNVWKVVASVAVIGVCGFAGFLAEGVLLKGAIFAGGMAGLCGINPDLAK